MEVLVYGAGSLGSLLGGLLAREHDVTLVGRAPHVSAVVEHGLRVSGAVERTVHPDATTHGTDHAADLALVTVKAYDTETAAVDLATGTFDAVCSLQNGLGNEATLAAHVDCPVLAGTATYGAVLRGNGHVECTGVGEVTLGPREGGDSAVADRAGAAFDAAGVETTVASDMPRRLWEKLAVNAGINAVTALARVENGALADGDAAALARDAARETARVARAHDVALSTREAVAAVDAVVAATADNDSSMFQDVRDERRTEVDAINGHVVDAAATVREGHASTPADPHAIDAPVNRTLARLLRAWETARGLR